MPQDYSARNKDDSTYSAKQNRDDSTYTAKQIQVLEGLEPVRKRPGMYVGSTDISGLQRLITEIVDNSIDEALAGHAKNCWLTIFPDGKVAVADDGRGIPVDVQPKVGKSALEVAMTYLHAGAKFEKGAYKVSGGLHGVGASAVNALSDWTRVEVKRAGIIYSQEYKRGKAKTKVLQIEADKSYKLANFSWDEVNSGTKTIFSPDKSIFSTIHCDFAILKKQLKERAYLVAGLYFHLFDARSGEEASYYFDGGISSLVRSLNKNKNVVNDPPFSVAKDVN